jgi:Uma2 family endonuclease
MSAITDISEKISRQPAEQKMILHNVSWKTYQNLLADFANQSSPRLTYDRGTLEIMSPLSEHEHLKHILEQIVDTTAEELGIDVKCFGSTTFKREDLERGFESDSCYYIQHESSVSGKSDIDLSIDPPPDLVIEVDITSSSLNKFPIYSKIGVLEIWRHDGKNLTIYKLSGEAYVESETSPSFPLIVSADISDFIEKNSNLKSTVFLKLLREWIRSRK